MPKKKKVDLKPKNYTLTYYIILAVIAFAVYANSLSNQFVFDDESVVLADPTIEHLSNIPKYFTGEMGFHKVIGSYYRPVVSSSYAIDYAIWKFNPYGFHLTNILIHVINTLLLYALLLLMFKKSESVFKNYAILIGTVIFAVHPIHTEVVAWVSGRTDGLSCTFFFAAFIYYLKYSDKEYSEKQNLYFGLTLFFYLLALFAKEMAITFPVIIILYDFIIKRKEFKNELKHKLVIYSTLIIASVLFMILRWYALKDVPIRATYYYFYRESASTVFYTMLQTIPFYLKLAVAPYDMLYHYSGFLPYQYTFFTYNVMFAAALIIAMGVVIYLLYKKLPYVSYALLFFFISLIPVLNIVPTMNFMADRFLYIPSAFLSIAVTAVIFKYYSKKTSGAIIAICGLIIVAYSYMTVTRNAQWKDNDTLFLSAGGKPGTVIYVNIGNIYANKGEFDIAEAYYRKAIDLRSETLIANNNLGKIFMVKGFFDSAYYYMHKAYLLDTLSPEPMHTLAQLYARFEMLPEAIWWLEKVTSFAPKYMNADQMLLDLKTKQQLLLSQQNDTGSVKQNQKINPDAQQKIIQLEQSSYKYYQAKDYDKSIEELKQLIKINPLRASGYYNNIGMCYLDQAKYQEAIENFTLSIKEDVKFSTAYNNLGNAYEKSGDKQKAREYYKKAIEVDPNNAIAKQNLEILK